MWTPQAILAGALLAILVSFGTVDFFGHHLSASQQGQPDSIQSVWADVAAFGFMGVAATVLSGALLSAFRRGNTKELLITVFVSYFSLMLLFASVYYEAAFFGDYRDALFKYENYRADALKHIAGPAYESRRAFYGIEPRFWSGVDWPVRAGRFPNGLPPGAYRVGIDDMRRIAGNYPAQDVIQFLPEARVEIFADCLHLSVITMTTVGYGDITPRSFSARTAADIEAVCNTLLLIFGVGVILGARRREAETQDAGRP